jgi:Alginate export
VLLVLAVLGFGAPSAHGQAPGPAAPAPPPAASAPSPALPSWLAFHGSQRTRYETIDHRYGPSEVGGDQQLAFRSRLQVAATWPSIWGLAEVEDARITLNDSASTITASHVTEVKMLQFHVGARRRNLWGRGLDAQLEVGRFSRDFGDRRVLARQVDRNATSAFDGAIARVGAKAWSVQGLYFRPRVYAYPSLDVDPRFRGLSIGGLYATSTKVRAMNADVYLLRMADGPDASAATTRRMTIPGVRLLGQIGTGGRVDYEVEAVGQVGRVGGLPHRASLVHAQTTYQWPKVKGRPRLFAIYDHATGDADPTDRKSGTYDQLFGARRFELGPSGVYLLVARTNISSPALQLSVRPTASAELTIQQRHVRLASARDRWRSSNLWDPTGAAGADIGWQTDVRLRYRWRQYFEFDGAFVVLKEGEFPRRLRPSGSGYTTFLTTAVEVRF